VARAIAATRKGRCVCSGSFPSFPVTGCAIAGLVGYFYNTNSGPQDFRKTVDIGNGATATLSGNPDNSCVMLDIRYSGTVASIRWHQKENKPMYLLKVGGTIKSRRYWPEKLEKI